MAVVAFLALIVSGLTACAANTGTHADHIEVHAGQDVALVAGGGAVEVQIPGSAISGTGELSVTPVSGEERTAGWHIALSGGARLQGRATLRFKHTFTKGEPAPLIVSTENDETYQVAQGVKIQNGYAVVTTTHFSNWFTTWWDNVMDHLRGELDQLYKGSGKAPTCSGEDAVRKRGYSVRSDSGSSVFWCLGQDASGAPELKVVNGRGYTVESENTPGLSVTDSDRDDLVGIIANLIKEVPSEKGNTVNLVGPGGGITYGVDGSGVMGVQVQPSAAGYLVAAAQYAVDTVDYVISLAHGGMSKSKVEKLFNWETCFSGYTSMTTTNIQTASQASHYFTDAMGTALGCAGDAIEKAGLGFLGTAFASAMSWLISGVRTAMNGFGAVADSALNPTGYTIYITAPTSVSPSTLPVLGMPWAPYQEGFGTARPTRVFNGGDPSGGFTITWDSWGGATASGHGTALWLDPGQEVADGTVEPAQFEAYDLGTCQGKTAYLHLAVWFPQHGQAFDPQTNNEASYTLCPS